MGEEEKPKRRTGSFGKDHLQPTPPRGEDQPGPYQSDVLWQHADAVAKSKQPAKSVTFDGESLPPEEPVELEFEPAASPGAIAIEELPEGDATAEEIQNLASEMLLKVEEGADTRQMLTEIIKRTPANSQIRHVAVIGLSLAEEQEDPQLKELLRKDTLRQLAYQPPEIVKFVRKGERTAELSSANPIKLLARRALDRVEGQDTGAIALQNAVDHGSAALLKIKILSPPRAMAHVIATEALEMAKNTDLKARHSLYLDALKQIATVIPD